MIVEDQKFFFHFVGLGCLTYQVHRCPRQGLLSQTLEEGSAWLPEGAPHSHHSVAKAGTWRVGSFLQPWGKSKDQ